MKCFCFSAQAHMQRFSIHTEQERSAAGMQRPATTLLWVSPYCGRFFQNQIWRRTAVRHGLPEYPAGFGTAGFPEWPPAAHVQRPLLPEGVNDHIAKIVGCSIIRYNTGKGDLPAGFAATCSVSKGMLHGQPLLLLGTVRCPMSSLQQGHNSIHLHIVKAFNDIKILHRCAPDCGKAWFLWERTFLNPPAASS